MIHFFFFPFVSKLLTRNARDCGSLGSYQSVHAKLFIPVFRRRLIDNFLVELNACTSMATELKHGFEICPTLLTLYNDKLKNAASKLRLSSHQLSVEFGRYRGIERQTRKYILCTKKKKKRYRR